MHNWRTYIVALLITGALFGTTLFASNYFNAKRIAEIQNIEERIATDILSLETQFDLLEQLSCTDIAENAVLSREINSLGRRLAFTETQLGTDNEEVVQLKEQYTLLQIKDYLLMQKIAEKCALDPVFILYFYSNEGDCDDCVRAGHVLTRLRELYPELRVYAFDYHLDIGALRTLVALNDIEPNLPALVIDKDVHYGFYRREEIEELLPVLKELETATSTEETVDGR